MIHTYLLTRCAICGAVTVVRADVRRCLACIQQTFWYTAMSPTGRALIVRDFGAATLRLTREADEDARLRRLLAPVEVRLS